MSEYLRVLLALSILSVFGFAQEADISTHEMKPVRDSESRIVRQSTNKEDHDEMFRLGQVKDSLWASFDKWERNGFWLISEQIKGMILDAKEAEKSNPESAKKLWQKYHTIKKDLLSQQRAILERSYKEAGFNIVADRGWPSDFEYHAILEKNGKHFFVEADYNGMTLWSVEAKEVSLEEGRTPSAILQPYNNSHEERFLLHTEALHSKDKYLPAHFQRDFIEKPKN